MLNLIIHAYNKLMIYKYRRYVLSQERSGMHIGKNVMICPGVKFDPPHSFLTSIGDNCTIAPDVRFLNHDAALFRIAGFARIGKITIKENCFIGAGSLLLPGITIGPNSIIGALSIVTKDIAPDTIAAGNPAKPINNTSVYKDLCRQLIDKNESPHFQSNDFYNKLYNNEFKKKFLHLIGKDIAFTIGGDNDYTFYFNRT